jgi:hypothetical protein
MCAEIPDLILTDRRTAGTNLVGAQQVFAEAQNRIIPKETITASTRIRVILRLPLMNVAA